MREARSRTPEGPHGAAVVVNGVRAGLAARVRIVGLARRGGPNFVVVVAVDDGDPVNSVSAIGA